MKPGIAEILMTAANTLGTEIAPHLIDKPYALGSTGTIGLMLVFLAQDADRAVETLVRDNAEMRAIFAAASTAEAALGLPAPVVDAARAAAAGADPGLRMQVLEAENATLKAVLIAVHTAVDDVVAPWAQALQREIWTHLKASAERRSLALPMS